MSSCWQVYNKTINDFLNAVHLLADFVLFETVFVFYCVYYVEVYRVHLLMMRADIKGSIVPSLRSLLVVEERMSTSGCI